MDWSTISRRFGKIIKCEAWRRWNIYHDQNIGLDDLMQCAAFAAWNYCRKRKFSEIDPPVLRNVIRAALYDAAVESRGIHLSRNNYRCWTGGSSGYPISRVESLDDLLERDVVHDIEDERYDSTVASVNVFVASLSEPERRVLDACLRSGQRWYGVIARNTGMSPKRAHSALRSLRKRARRYFEFSPAGNSPPA